MSSVIVERWYSAFLPPWGSGSQPGGREPFGGRISDILHQIFTL